MFSFLTFNNLPNRPPFVGSGRIEHDRNSLYLQCGGDDLHREALLERCLASLLVQDFPQDNYVIHC